MSISFDCPSCGRNLKVSDFSAGKTVICPGCRESVNVPEEVLEAETFGSSSTPSPSESRTPAKEDNDRRPCRMCGEMIPVEAAKCRYCGEVFDPELRRLEERKKGPDYDNDLTAAEWVVAILCSGIGCICGIVWMIQGKPKGTKMFGVSLLFAVLWNVIRFALLGAGDR